VNMENFPASGYYMAADDGPDGGSDLSLGAAAAKEPDQTGRPGRAGGGRRSKSLRRSPKSPTRLKHKGRANSEIHREERIPPPPTGQLERTKRLLMAALRVWELKRGIR
jgi:hypothetical protein